MQDVVAGFLLVLEAEGAVANVVQVLQLLKEGYGHTTCIHIRVLSRADYASDLLLRVTPRPMADPRISPPLPWVPPHTLGLCHQEWS